MTKISAETLLRSKKRQLHGDKEDEILVPRRRRFGRLNLCKQLTEYPNQAVVVSTPEDLGNECSTPDQKLDGEFETHEDKLGLTVSVLDPSGTDVWSTVMEDNVGLPVL